ncbi:MAG: 4-alpha-glucanotransferase [Citrobacter freundii]|nr:MAG: 4-alpha-glucanotransferase [Citrobacter freundii]
MLYRVIFFWKKLPVIRLLIPFFMGLAQQYYWPLPVSVIQGLALICTALVGFYSLPLFPFFHRYKSGFINGLSVFILFAALGALSVWRQDARNRSLWPGNIYKESDALVIKLLEKPVERTNTLKSEADLFLLIRDGRQIPVRGTILTYFSKDSDNLRLSAGDEIITTAALVPVPSNANPGGFDFHRYALFQGITHQVFIKKDFVVTGNSQPWLQRFVGNIRQWVLSVLQKAFPGKRERGLAEALMIGYKNELDKTLVQSYTNTGVVHIIAISGLHLGLIYWLLVKLLQPISSHRRLKWLAPVLIIGGLWIFTLLAGAQPSVLRSAIMFTCIVIGNSLSRRSSIYNSLALSAFILLCYNPYWLWDAGFQLSYTAIIGIVGFMKPVYGLMSFKNKLVDMIWQMNAVTIAAQLLTLPVCIYHFHQFPNYFLISNFIAVPVSSLILLAELLLCAVSFIPFVFIYTAKLCSVLISFMNTSVERIEQLPFAVWNGLQISLPQAGLLMILIVTLLSCFVYKEKIRLLAYISLISITIFTVLRCASFMEASRQQKIIIYQQAIDFVNGRNYVSFDTKIPANDLHTKATRILFRLKPARIATLARNGNLFSFLSKKIVLAGSGTDYFMAAEKPLIDLLILTQDPTADPAGFPQTMNIRQVVADATVPAWKCRKWQQRCDSLGIPFHDVRSKGAFVMNL